MAEFPLQPRKAFFPTKPRGTLIPQGSYLRQDSSPSEAIIPYSPTSRVDLLPASAANFEMLMGGSMPLIIADPTNQPKPELVESFFMLMTNLGSAQSWRDLYEKAGMLHGGKGINNTDLYVIDRHNRRYLVLDVELDWGGETGYLSLRPVGRGSRGGRTISVDIEEAYSYMIPVLLMRKRPGRLRNPRIRTSDRVPGGRREKTRHCKVCKKVTQEGKQYCTDHVNKHDYVVDLIRRMEASNLEEADIRHQGYQAVKPESIIADDILITLRNKGSRTIERLSRELMRSHDTIERYVEYLYHQGLVALSESNRGKIVVRLVD